MGRREGKKHYSVREGCKKHQTYEFNCSFLENKLICWNIFLKNKYIIEILLKKKQQKTSDEQLVTLAQSYKYFKQSGLYEL